MFKKIIFSLLIVTFCLTIYTLELNKNVSNPYLKLKGKTIITLIPGETYKEDGYFASDFADGDITGNVKIKNAVNTQKKGIYEILYSVKNSSNKKTIKKRIVMVRENVYKDEYDNIDNTSRGWWSNNKLDQQRPSGGADINELRKYNAYFLGKDEKVIYLTFDEGSLETYVKEIADVLDKNKVKATFFLCKTYIEKNPELINHLFESGHSIGNHTHHHQNMPSLATRENFDKYISELRDTEDAFYKITGEYMDKVYREPRGEWSYRDLAIMKDLGYRTFFYSANYDDFSKVLSKEEALNNMMKRYHNGAIYLIHPNNKGNYEALETFIIQMKKLGYKFDLVKNIG